MDAVQEGVAHGVRRRRRAPGQQVAHRGVDAGIELHPVRVQLALIPIGLHQVRRLVEGAQRQHLVEGERVRADPRRVWSAVVGRDVRVNRVRAELEDHRREALAHGSVVLLPRQGAEGGERDGRVHGQHGLVGCRADAVD